ncbi:hypothetical protein GWI72_07505 [Microvirga tunisiensis]|uniref:Uncharacterized protein n=2 Tax=Pannonibacter tanglangensis TaxID=2750084 RepID=A0ABW9ZEL3_9HYPH|nr:hypothetical protein [Pannonibacter sp. XCT-34]NBN78108.1 hypothetical protein [Pannonibacter sp. XCT-53]
MTALTAGTATAALAADPVAMVLDRSEGVNATAFAELMPGDEIALGTGGHVDLLDYTACREVRITGGSVTATSGGLVVAEGEEKELRPGNCLKQEASNAGTDGGKGLAVTMRGLIPENKVAASLMLRFGDDLKERYDSVFVSVDGGAPQEYKLDDKVLAEMPDLAAAMAGKTTDANGVPIELVFKPRAGTGEAEVRQFTLDPLEVGRETAVVVVK